jgi:hypothetical protein
MIGIGVKAVQDTKVGSLEEGQEPGSILVRGTIEIELGKEG